MEKASSKTQMIIGISLLGSVVLIGAIGFMIIEKVNILDSFYMTIITISTVGFREVVNLSEAGKVFTIFLIISSFGVYTYGITTISANFIEGRLSYFLTGYKSKTIKKMRNHVIVVGYGRNGQQVVNELSAHKDAFLIIDNSEKVIQDFKGRKELIIQGDATVDAVLEQANIKVAKSVITTLPVDADNLYVVLAARALNPDLLIISRASNESSEQKLRMAGVDNVVMPEKVGGAHMASLVITPDIMEFLEHISIHGNDPTNLEEIICENPDGKVKTKTIFEIGVRRKTGANIIGFKTSDGELVLNPPPDTKVMPGSKLFVLGKPDEIRAMKEILKEPDDE